MADVKPIPEGYHSLTPYLVVDGAAEAIDYYKKAFGATELFRMEHEGKIVSGKKGRTVSDGPFAESKEAVGGYFYLQVANMDEAIEIARQCPGLDHGIRVEVRPVADMCTARARAIAEASGARQLASAT